MINIKSGSLENLNSKRSPNSMASTYSPSLINFFRWRFGYLKKALPYYEKEGISLSIIGFQVLQVVLWHHSFLVLISQFAYNNLLPHLFVAGPNEHQF